MNNNSWGWTSYRRTLWVRPDGMRLYFAHFLRVSAPGVLAQGQVTETVRIHFWAKRPVLALRRMVTSGENPAHFDGKDMATDG